MVHVGVWWFTLVHVGLRWFTLICDVFDRVWLCMIVCAIGFCWFILVHMLSVLCWWSFFDDDVWTFLMIDDIVYSDTFGRSVLGMQGEQALCAPCDIPSVGAGRETFPFWGRVHTFSTLFGHLSVIFTSIRFSSGDLLQSYWTWPSRNNDLSHDVSWWFSICNTLPGGYIQYHPMIPMFTSISPHHFCREKLWHHPHDPQLHQFDPRRMWNT